VLNWSDAQAQSNDSVIVIQRGQLWHNHTSYDYIALSEQRARILLAQSYAIDSIDSLYLIEATKVFALQTEIETIKNEQLRERLALLALLVLLLLK